MIEAGKLRIGLDIDDVLVDFMGAYLKRFGKPKADHFITKNVYKMRKDKQFWENLPKLNDINFIPELYCTKRVCSKVFTKNSLMKCGFPKRNIFQMYYQHGNKADMIKGKVDLFIDDSVSNMTKMINSGIPCFLMDAPHNRYFNTVNRIYNLDYTTILNKYNEIYGK